MHHFYTGEWLEEVYFWRPSGLLQCLPIFAMALFCQTQLFEIYQTVPNSSLEKMDHIVKGALNICTVVYLSVGFFGYIAFCTQPFTGKTLNIKIFLLKITEIQYFIRKHFNEL